jgi:hypothetical protein
VLATFTQAIICALLLPKLSNKNAVRLPDVTFPKAYTHVTPTMAYSMATTTIVKTKMAPKLEGFFMADWTGKMMQMPRE